MLGWFVFPAVPPPAPQNASTDASTYGGRTTAMRNLTEARIREIYEDFTQGKLERLAEAFDTNVDFLSHAPSEFFPCLGHRRGRAAVLEAVSESGRAQS